MDKVVRLVRGAGIWIAMLYGAAGCLEIPENDPYYHRDDPNSTRYKASCICVARDAPSMRMTNDVTTCHVPAKYVFYHDVEPKLAEVCDRGDTQFTDCFLADVLTDPQGGFGCGHENSCVDYGCCYTFTHECRDIQCDSVKLALQDVDMNCLEQSARVVPPQGPSSWSTANVSSGTLQIQTSAGNGSSSMSGRLAFIGGNCATGTCPFQLVDLALEGTNFSIHGESITKPVVINTTLGDGILLADASVFMMPAQSLQIYATAQLGGERQGLLAMSAMPGFGIINQRTRQLVFAQSFTVGSGTIDVQFAATIENLMPTVSLADTTLECNNPGGSNTTLRADVADVDGRVVRVKWFIDGIEQPETSATLDTFLALGTHTVEVGAFDNDGGFASAKASIVVQDTTPPQISTDPVCIWPPNHKLYVVDASSVHVTDACDPNISATLLSGASNQVGNGTGDGNTSEDIFVHPDSVCVRAERDGSVLYGRTYTIAASATDSSSNTSTFTFDITVPHDSSPRCLEGATPAEDGDARCTPAPARRTATDATFTQPKTSSCNTSGSNGGLFVLCALLLMRRRRG